MLSQRFKLAILEIVIRSAMVLYALFSVVTGSLEGGLGFKTSDAFELP